jgi:serine kinase of HPr protein (carbohydrate metabolism regulator)
MNVKDLIEQFDLQVAAGEKELHREIRNGYCGDLLSDVIANAPEACVWMTIQVHQNIIAVAVLREMAAIVLCGGQTPDDNTCDAAKKEGLPVLLWPGTAYELAGRLYANSVGRSQGI